MKTIFNHPLQGSCILQTYIIHGIHCNLMIKAKWQWITVNTLFNRLLLLSDEISKYFLLHINLSLNGTSLLFLILISRFSLKMSVTADIDNQIDSTRSIHTYHWLFQQQWVVLHDHLIYILVQLTASFWNCW